MADRSLDTGEFNEYGKWRSYQDNDVRSGPSPFPLLVLAVLIAMIMLLKPGSEPRPVAPKLPGVDRTLNW